MSASTTKMAALRLPPLPTIADIIRTHKLSARKSLSQNFLLNERITDKIVKKAGDLTGSYVLEVGPGPGALTRSIMRQNPKKLILVEKDHRFLPTLNMLQEAFELTGSKIDIIINDILKVQMDALFPKEIAEDWNDKRPRIFIIGNLPFSVSTHLIIKWLKAISEHKGPWSLGRSKMTLTFQKEVAERLVAPEYGVQRCRLSVMAQAWTFPNHQFTIPGRVFVPKPDVDVGVVSFVPLMTPQTKHSFDFFELITRTLFPLYCRKEMGETLCKIADIDPTLKPTQLSVSDVDKIATAYEFLLQKHTELQTYDYRASRRLLHDKYLDEVTISDYRD
ncbi:dimethyladenosine transferase 1, mitochondrial isoform X2 [Prorops nasuta]|uniref:dimethyladenosine transferase 1, mitochondrial isoform X2 n=1 Tax=Prorops nasuta TaxID=863751 RepID=UPI0034CE768F